MRTIRELKDGSQAAGRWADQLHEMLCSADTSSSSGVPFTTLFEQQDSHDLMFYLLEKVTKITAKFARQSAWREGLSISLDLLNETQADHDNQTRKLSHSQSETSTQNSLSESWLERPRSVSLYRRLRANTLIGLNPLASIVMNTIECPNCGPYHQSTSH